MKKIVLLLLIIYTTNAFSQTYGDSASGKFDKMSDLANHNKDDEAKKIADELLSGKYGELGGLEKFFTLLVVADYYYQKDDYQKASDSYQQFLDFDKNENPKKIENKKIYIAEAKGKLEELKPKLSLVSANTTNTAVVTDTPKDESNKTSDTKLVNGNIASDNSTIQADKKETNTDKTVIQADKKETNTDKTVTLTVSGTGKTLEEARLNGLRSAIEQAFGAFISSKTEILNDNLVKDEIVSIASGNVQKYDVVSQIEIPNNGYAITLSATVSISKLTTFAESKGVVVEFKGGVFAANIKLQKLNETSENNAMVSLYELIHEKFQTVFDYNIETKNPFLNEDKINYSVPITVTATANKNYDETITYLIETLKSLSLKETEVLEYNNLRKQVYKVNISFNENKISICLRSEITMFWIQKIYECWDFYLGNYLVENGINTIEGPGGFRFKVNYQDIHFYPEPKQPFILSYNLTSTEWESGEINGYTKFSNGKITRKLLNDIELDNEKKITEIDLVLPQTNSVFAKFEWNDVKTLNEIEKISAYSVKSAGIVSKFKYGGYVIYEKNGHGIIASPYYFNTNNDWGKYNKFIGTENKLYAGKSNTDKISTISEINIGKFCKSISTFGYNDWVIPSSEEMELILHKLYFKGIICNNGEKFISSTEANQRGDLKAYNFMNYIIKLTEDNLIDKDFSFSNVSNKTSYDDTFESQIEKHTIQPIRYF